VVRNRIIIASCKKGGIKSKIVSMLETLCSQI
jgi:hypothetical protein